MKYMTPALIVRGQSQNPEDLDAVEVAWEENGALYRAYLAHVRSELPAGLTHLLDGFHLHDARVVAMSRPAGGFQITLEIETAPRRLLELRYDLLAEPHITEGVLPPSVASQGDWIEWWYDEVERLPGEQPTWRHSILLSNGWEIALDCRDVRLEEAQPIWPRLPLTAGTAAPAFP